MTTYSDSQSLTMSELTSILTSMGGEVTSPSEQKYVIHLSTIPLATMLNVHNFHKNNSYIEPAKRFHGYELGNEDECCEKRNCMFTHRVENFDGSLRIAYLKQCISPGCPCLEIEKSLDYKLQNRCFLHYAKGLKYIFSELRPDEVNQIPGKEVVFCHDQQCLFDDKYSGPMRDRVNSTGWSNISEKNILIALNQLYWFRANRMKLNLPRLIFELIDKVGFRKVKHAITQSLHTINGCISKLLLAMPDCLETYEKIEACTAHLFRGLIVEYCQDTIFVDGKPTADPNSLYNELKNTFNFIKERFHNPSYERRVEILNMKFNNKAVKYLFDGFRKLKAKAAEYSSAGMDFTLTMSFIIRCSILAQTRILGYLPNYLAEVKRYEFRENISREVEFPEPERIEMIRCCVREGIKNHIKGGVLSNFENDPELFNQAIGEIDLNIKISASTDTFVKDGGKLEDARNLIRMAIENRWEIPVWDLNTDRVKETFTISGDYEVFGHQRPLFWICYNLVRTFCITREFVEGEPYRFFDRGKEYLPDILSAKIVHISESGKERNLTKSTTILDFFLTVASKLCQTILAELPAHRAGLTSSGHEWQHLTRISPYSDESGFMYHGLTGKLKERVISSFKDWRESTDFIGKIVGWTHLETFMEYIGFPERYMELVSVMITEPQPVTEVIHHKIFDGEEMTSPIKWEGFVREGFMQGNKVTKTILHLQHVSEDMFVQHLLSQEYGLEHEPSFKYGTFKDSAIDRAILREYEAIKEPQRKLSEWK